jgi:predicted phosphodiesterase
MKIGFIADIHEDLIRLKESLRILKRNKCDEVVCLGDITGYCVPYYGYFNFRNAHESISLIKKDCNKIVVGNHDLYAIRKIPKYKAGFNYPKNWYTLDYLQREKISKGKVSLYENNELSPLITSKDEKFIKKLPEFLVVNFDGIKILLSHAAYPSFSGSMDSDPENPKEMVEHFKFMKRNDCKLSIHGHDHSRVMGICQNKVTHYKLGEKIKILDAPFSFYCPCVANGTCPNGLMILDTIKKEIQTIPLNTPAHKVPDWKKK